MFGVKITLAILSLILTFGGGNAQLKTLRTLGSWMDMEYEFPSAAHKDAAVRAGQYVPLNGIPIDVDVDYKGRYFYLFHFEKYNQLRSRN